MTPKKTIVLSLISHTNIGKTTLARTFLRRDIGEVKDETHVTDQSTAYTMLETATEALVLWDTPGFGNVAQLLKRLKSEKGAWGWLMHEVVDRVFNRSLFCSLAAARNVKNRADVVLYLVNVCEHPGDAGYIPGELTLLEALGKPVIMILNQVGNAQLADPAARQRLVTIWHKHFSKYPHLKKVMVLDAFTRTWHQELGLIEALTPLVSADARAGLNRLAEFHRQQQSAIFKRCADHAATLLWHAKCQQLDPKPEKNPKILFEKLVSDLQNRLDLYLDVLVEAHGIQSEGRAKFQTDLQQVTGQTATKLDEKKSGLLAGALSSAGTGLVADVFSGGLTLGGGAILGFLGGYVGGLSFAKVMNLRKRDKMTWRHDTLVELYQLLIIYYLVASHHGRGRGKLDLGEPLQFIVNSTAKIWSDQKDSLKALLEEFQDTVPDGSPANGFITQASNTFRQTVDEVIHMLYPESA